MEKRLSNRELAQLRQSFREDYDTRNPPTPSQSRPQMDLFDSRKRRLQASDTGAAPKRPKNEPLSTTSSMPPLLPKHDSVQPEPEADFYNRKEHPYPRVIRLPERRYPGKGLLGFGIPLILQRHEEENRAKYRTSPPRRISKKSAARECRRVQFMTLERKEEERKHQENMREVLADPFFGQGEKYTLMNRPHIIESPNEEFEFMESMASSDEDGGQEEEEDLNHEDTTQFKDLHLALKKAIIDGLEHDMHGQEQWRFPPQRGEGVVNHYVSTTILHVDIMDIDDANHESRVLTNQGKVFRPTEEEIQTAKGFLMMKGLPVGLIGRWLDFGE